MLFLLVALVIWCCNRVPDSVIQPEEMASLLADIHKGESVVESNAGKFPTDSAKRAFRQAIYKAHGVTTQQVDSSLRWYGYNMDKYIEVYDRAIELLNDEIAQVSEQAGKSGESTNVYASMVMEGDSVDIWYENRYRVFTPALSNRIVTFLFNSEPNWENGDVYIFKAKTINNSNPATLTVAVDYADGSGESFGKELIGNGWHEVRFALDSARVAREIYGTIGYNVNDSEVAYVDSISFTRTRWNRSKAPARDIMKPFKNKHISGAFD